MVEQDLFVVTSIADVNATPASDSFMECLVHEDSSNVGFDQQEHRQGDDWQRFFKTNEDPQVHSVEQSFPSSSAFASLQDHMVYT